MKPKPHTWYILYEELIDDTFQELLLYVIKKEDRKWKHYVLFLDDLRVRTDYEHEDFFINEDEYEEEKEENPDSYPAFFMEETTHKEALRRLNYRPQLKTNLFKHIFNE